MSTPVEVLMPQVWESMTEGKITKWLVEVGTQIERDQPLFEISTDKVDAEIPSPHTGVLSRVIHPVGAVVPVNAVVALINGRSDARAAQQKSETVSASPQKRSPSEESQFSTTSSAVSKRQPEEHQTLELVALCATAFIFPFLSGYLERWMPSYAASGIGALAILLISYPALGIRRYGFGRWSLLVASFAACISLANFIVSLL